jgi:hydrogenase maturation protein HypF
MPRPPFIERRAIAVRGTVQGVGFRPFVYGLAARLALRGFVRNQSDGVAIEVEGPPEYLDAFLERLSADRPPLARIEELRWERQQPLGEAAFRIEASGVEGPRRPVIAADVATCPECLAELRNPSDRRYRYPFLNCVNCGPRLTIVCGAPYDRARTTMAGFPLCAQCRAEYGDPGNRRFHAQPTACPECGPRLSVVDAAGGGGNSDALLDAFAALLQRGGIGAMKGLGGYHLVCDARRPATVADLRRRKQRDEKPLAVMTADAECAARLCFVSPAERQLLCSPARPIVLLRRRPDADVAEEVAPGNPLLGIMLPYTPLHHLLLAAVNDCPLVMTSGNRSDEPIAYEDDDAPQRLAGIADAFLVHNRPIAVRCDDSVTRVIAGREAPVRRSRGYAPQPCPLPLPCPAPILAVGGQLKATFALGRDRQAILSHHLGDLDHYAAAQAFERDIALYMELFAITPKWIAHDLHPDYASTRYARRLAAETGARCVPVQHHHAHLASCLAEHGRDESAIGVSLDGTGLGTDGAIWGGEFLVGDHGGYRRAARLRYVGLPGGDQAIRAPWRIALAHLVDASVEPVSLASRVPAKSLRIARTMLARGVNSPLTSSMGRLFDAAAVLAGGRTHVSYEGQAAIELEWQAAGDAKVPGYPFALAAPEANAPLEIDTRPLIRALTDDAAAGVARQRIARRFHAAIRDMIVAVCTRLRADGAPALVALSGGVFLNAVLVEMLEPALEQCGFEVLRHSVVPTNDGGLSLGQLAVAARRIALGQVE